MNAELTIEETNLFRQATETVKALCAENAALREENRRLREHVRDLDHDLNSVLDECNKHCGEE